MEGTDHVVATCDMSTDLSAMVVFHMVKEVLMVVACWVLYWVDTIGTLITNFSDIDHRWIVTNPNKMPT
uniref:Uncharacterized protein n=1 Tax=Parascaris equorum TaxID=6256 RepID=A0A914RGX3_PAREQ